MNYNQLIMKRLNILFLLPGIQNSYMFTAKPDGPNLPVHIVMHPCIIVNT